MATMKQQQPTVSRWLDPAQVENGQYGCITNAEWCEIEVARINTECGRDVARVVENERTGEIAVTR